MAHIYFKVLIFFSIIGCFPSLDQILHKEEYSFNCDYQEQNCMSWNANVTLAPNLNLMELQIRIALFPNYKNCFTFYDIYLQKMWRQYFDQCDSSKSTRISLFKVAYKLDQVLSVRFNDLKNGNYCIEILPCKHLKFRGRNINACCDTWALHSDVVYLVKEVKKVKKLKETSFEISTLELVSVITISILILSCALAIYFKLKSRAFMHDKKSIFRIEEEELVQCLIPQNIIVYILHSQEEEIKKKVRLLKDFLANCASCTVILVEDILEEIYPDPIVWLNHMLEYKCSKKHDLCDSNKRIIIIQSESVLHHIKYKTNTITSKKRNSTVSVYSGDDDIENDWFHYALSSISIDWLKCLKDYCHLFVVCFNDVLCYDNSIKNITPDVRYTIPDQLVKLCIDLNHTLSKELLNKRLLEHPIKYLTEENHQTYFRM